MAFDSDPQWQQEEIKPSRLKSCWFAGLAMVMVLSLLASSAASVVWLLTRNTQATAVAPTISHPPAHEPLITEITPPANEVERESATAVAQPPAELNRIVLINGKGQVETVAPDGRDRRILTEQGFIYQFPAWSPDGQQIAAIGSHFSQGGLYVLRDDSSESRITELYSSRRQNPFYLYWAPDSHQISFLASHPDGIGLNMVSVDGQSENRVIATGSPFYWNWAEDSEQLLIHSGSNDEARLGMIDDEGADRAVEVSQPGPFQAPGISVNGRYWAYAQLKAGGNSWLIVHDTKTGQQVEERHAGSLALSWRPNGDKIAYISSDNSTQSSAFWGPLRLLDAATGNVSLLTADTVLAFFWSPDGQHIAYLTPTTRDLGGIEVNNTLPGKMGKVAKQEPMNAIAQGGPLQLSLSVVNIETGQGLRLLDFQPPTLFLAQFLPFFDQYALSHRLWSPASDALVLPVVVGNESQIVVVPISGGQTRQIGTGTSAFWSQN